MFVADMFKPLVEQRLEAMIVLAIYHDDIYGRPSQCLGGVQATEAGADDHNFWSLSRQGISLDRCLKVQLTYLRKRSPRIVLTACGGSLHGGGGFQAVAVAVDRGDREDPAAPYVAHDTIALHHVALFADDLVWWVEAAASRVDIRSKPNVLQLLRIAGQVDCDDAAIAVFDGHRIDRSIVLAHDEARKAVDRCGPSRNGGKRWVLARNAGKKAQNPVGTADRVEGRGAFAAAIGIQHCIFGENPRKDLRIAGCNCGLKSCGESMTLFARGRKARPAGLDVGAGTRRELTAGGLAATKRVRHLGEVETEDVVQEETRPL
jgi:hypothetical protein